MRKLIEKKDKPREGSNGNLDQDKKEAVQSFEDYKHEKYSPESFEEFVLSDE